MAERVPALISAVLSEGDFDVTEATALRWLDSAHRLMVKRSKCLRKRIALEYGNTSFFSSGSGGATEGSKVLTSISSFTGLVVGLSISDSAGAIPALTTITTLDPIGSTVTISNPASSTVAKDKYAASPPEGFAYPLPEEVLEVVEVLVNGVPYGRGRHSDIAVNAQGWLLISGLGGVTVEDESSSGSYALSIVPPISGDAKVEVYAVCRAPALLASDDSTLKVPPEYDTALIEGAFSSGLRRDEGRPELAGSYKAEFDAACTELRMEVTRRNAPKRARVSGYTT